MRKLLVGAVTRARLPLVTSTNPCCCNRNSASRIDGRPTPKRSAKVFSDGSWLPTVYSPLVIAFSRSSTISWDRLRRPTA